MGTIDKAAYSSFLEEINTGLPLSVSGTERSEQRVAGPVLVHWSKHYHETRAIRMGKSAVSFLSKTFKKSFLE